MNSVERIVFFTPSMVTVFVCAFACCGRAKSATSSAAMAQREFFRRAVQPVVVVYGCVMWLSVSG